MDTEAIYQAIGAYGASKAAREPFETDENMAEIKRLLNEADEEHKSLLAENERLVDEINEARKEISEQARLNGMGAEREARLMAENAELKAKLTEKASLLRGCYARINTLERTLTHIHGVALAEDHRDLPGIAKDAKDALEKKHRTVTYVCPVCVASLERQE